VTSDLQEFHDELRGVARDLLGKAGSDVDWGQLTDAGWPGLEVPESLSGAGASFVETAILLEELGRAAAQTRYLGTVLAVGALMAVSPNDARGALLESVGAGATAAFASGFTVSGGVVSGRAEFVPDAEGAEVVLLLADDDGAPVVVTAPQLSVTAQPVLDETRTLSVVTADAAAVSESWPLAVEPGVLRDRAAVAVACDSLGVAEAMLSATVDYVKVRHQFGRPIGSFQAVKHACADMLVQCSVARQLVTAAVAKVAEGGDASVAAAMAKSYACGTAVEVVGKAMQLHGGIGYTWESGVHVYLKRAALNRALFGSPAMHRQRLALRYT
jgi:alkylation response protein AidB-like acyl-CoA dehydrogenase